MSRRSSYSTVLTTSVTCVVRQTCGLVRWTRSPMPVRLGVNTSWPASRSGPRTLRKPCAPPHAPCTRTKTAISVTLAEHVDSSGHLLWRIRQERAEYLPAQPERGRLVERLPGDLRVAGRRRHPAGLGAVQPARPPRPAAVPPRPAHRPAPARPAARRPSARRPGGPPRPGTDGRPGPRPSWTPRTGPGRRSAASVTRAYPTAPPRPHRIPPPGHGH